MTDRKVVIFDFGGVLGATDKAAVAKAVAALVDVSEPTATALMHDLSTAKATNRPIPQVWEAFSQRTGKILPDDLASYFDILKLIAIRPNKPALDLVKKLKAHGYRLAILSNVSPRRASYIRKLGIYNQFDHVALSCETGLAKPDQKAFQAILTMVQATPQECLFIDNNIANIAVAKKMGFDTITFSSVDQLENDLPAHGITLSPEPPTQAQP